MWAPSPRPRPPCWAQRCREGSPFLEGEGGEGWIGCGCLGPTDDVRDAPIQGRRCTFQDGRPPPQPLPLGPEGRRGPETASPPQPALLRGQSGRTQLLPPPGVCPLNVLPLPGPLCLGRRAGETEAARARRPVTRQIHQTAAAEGALKTLDPTLITCQPARPDAAQKLWNKRAISYYF